MKKMTLFAIVLILAISAVSAQIYEIRVNSGPELSIYSTPDCQVFEIWRSEDGVEFNLHQTVNRNDLKLTGPDDWGYRTYVDVSVQEGTKYFYKVFSNGYESNTDYGWSIFSAPIVPPRAQIFGNQIIWTWPEYNFGNSSRAFYFFRRANGNSPGPWGDNGDEISNECITDLETTDGKYIPVCFDEQGKTMSAGCSPVGYLNNTTSVENSAENYSVCSNYPNPFNPSTTIQFHLERSGNVQLVIYNQLGQEIELLVNEIQFAGDHTYVWNAGNLSAGNYYYRLQIPGQIFTGKMILQK